MATSQINPTAAAPGGVRGGSGSTRAPEGHRHPLRTAVRGAGVFLVTAVRVVVLGDEGTKN
jgi:hypothetical protein